MVKGGSGKKKNASKHQRLIDDYDDDGLVASDDVEAQKKSKSSKKKTPPSKKKKSGTSTSSDGSSSKKDDENVSKNDGNEAVAANDNDDVEDFTASIAADHERLSRSLGTIFDDAASHGHGDDDDDDESLFSRDEEIEVEFGMPTLTSSGTMRPPKKKFLIHGGGRKASGLADVDEDEDNGKAGKRGRPSCCCASRWGRLGCCLVVLILVAAAAILPLYFLGLIQFGGAGGGAGDQQQNNNMQQVGIGTSPTAGTAGTGNNVEQNQPSSPGLKGAASSSEDVDDMPTSTQLEPQGDKKETDTAVDTNTNEAPATSKEEGTKDTDGGDEQSTIDIADAQPSGEVDGDAKGDFEKESEGGKVNAKGEAVLEEDNDVKVTPEADEEKQPSVAKGEEPEEDIQENAPTKQKSDAKDATGGVEATPKEEEEEEEEEPTSTGGEDVEAAIDTAPNKEKEDDAEDATDETSPVEKDAVNTPDDDASEPAPAVDTRPQDVIIFEALAQISGDTVYVEDSPQNKAAKFMAFTDPGGPRDVASPLFLQRYALTTLYYSTSGDDWKPCLGCNPNARPFLSEAHECLWAGIMCLGTGQVVAIDFGKDGVDMSGPIPPEIGVLDELMRLSVPNNKITSLPNSIAETPIVELELSNNEISSFPTTLYGKRTLEKLYIDRNNFGEVPLPDFAAMPKLEHIQAHYNSFTGTIHSAIGARLPKLRNLDLSFNSLSGTIPPELGRLERLVRLDLDNNMLTGVVRPEIVSMPRLITFSASNNMLTGTLPPEIGSMASYWARNGLSRDKVIRLDNNKLSGELPEELGDIQGLAEVSLHGPENRFVGQMPQTICDSMSLAEFSLDCSAVDCSCTPACQCIGDYNPQVDATVAAEEVVSANADDEQDKDGATVTIDEPEPSEEKDEATEANPGVMSILKTISSKAIEKPGSPSNRAAQWIVLADPLARTEDDPRLIQRYCLATLFFSVGLQRHLSDADECSWNGVICDENTRMVVGIDLQGQNLVGSIPAEIGYLRYLKRLDLSNNSIGGIIPMSLGQTEIEHLILSNNSLRSPFPDTLYNKESIQQILIDRNLLTGGQPKWALMPNLTHISAFGNNFVGSLDPAVGSLTNLRVFLLSSNQLSGPIPEEYTNLVKLEKFEVAENMLSGEIPPALFGLPRLTSLSLANNHLSGKIGRLVRNMGSDWSKEGERKRKYVRLENNLLDGRIPDDLGEVEDLYLATLHGNSFQGKMPETICELKVATSGFSFELYKFTSDCDNVDCSCSKACQCL